MKITERRRGRETALKILYREGMVIGSTDRSFSSVMEPLEKHQIAKEFCGYLLEGIKENLTSIDEIIEKHSKNWTIDRISLIDLYVLRIAVFELLYCKSEVPFKVAIDEALELAKRYSSDESVKFLNGVLDSVAKSLKSDRN